MPTQNQEINRELLQKLFEKSSDIVYQEFLFKEQKVLFITCDGMVDQRMLQEVVVSRMQQFFAERKGPIPPEDLYQLSLPGFTREQDIEQMMTLVYSGFLLMYFEGSQLLFSVNVASKPNRKPEETRMEVLVKGPRDNFIEDLSTNIALIRKRLPTNSLCVEKIQVGRRSKTGVAILYMDDITNKEILMGIREKIQKIDTDIIISGDSMMELVNKPAYIFPRKDYTGRPDTAVQSITRGRVAILVDGVSYAIITPVNMFLLVKSGEDNDYPVMYASISRLLRIVGIGISLFLPAFWLSLITFHHNQLPLQLLATIVVSNEGLPFPSFLEMMVMLLLFELFREASLNLPTVVGGTISVVGGLIIGDAAIRAGITSPAMIVIIAVSTIAGYSLNNQELLTGINIFRVFLILFSATFGLFGFFIAFFIMLIYVASMRTYGAPYLYMISDLSWKTIFQTLFRLPVQSYKERPEMVKAQDKTRSSANEQKE